MNRSQGEQVKVLQYVKGIHPSVSGNYEEMVNLISKANKNVEEIGLSGDTKRIMYLQLIAHSVQESCQSLINEIDNAELIVEIGLFHRKVTSFCRSWLTSEELTDFNVLQERESISFTQTWEKIVGEMKRQNRMIQ